MDLADPHRHLDRLRLLVRVPVFSPSRGSRADSNGSSRSVKWVGMFVTALVGLYTVEDLWNKFGDLRMSYVSGARC